MKTEFLNHDDKGKQIQFVDARYYCLDKKPDKYYPGVTNILGVIDRGDQYKKWLQSNGFNADVLAKEAMEQGSRVHEAIQHFLLGVELRWANDQGGANYTRKEWTLISRFMDFYKGFTPIVEAVEKVLVSEKLEFGSQLDLVCVIDNERWLIDHKTGSLYDSANLQLAALKQLWDEYYPQQPIDKCGVLHLESTHRGRDKQGKSIQGKGWKLVECENTANDWEDFKHIHAIWKRKNPDYKPFNVTYPDRYSIETINQIELPF